MSIHVLSSEVIDQIAAGEVVERPAHMVKELVENALDAGASEIEVDFAQGGRTVSVTDNGSGIVKEELALALARHATSKISQSQDLWALHSFGFRGEALASISAVCKLQLTSRKKGSAEAYQIVNEFGKISSPESVSGADGTRIHIEELFSNTPARLKFLKSEAAEGVQIKNVMRAMALTHPGVEFRLLQRGKLLFYWPKAETAIERARQIFEIDELYEGRATYDTVSAHAIFTDPNTTVKTSKSIWLFSQNRWIQDRSLQTAVGEAYRNLLMHGEFPTAAVFLTSAPDEVDVNIHPTKSKVKLKDPGSGFRAVRNAIKSTLEQAPWLDKLLGSKPPGVSYKSTDFSFSVSEERVDPVNTHFNDPSFEVTQFQKKSHAFRNEFFDETSKFARSDLENLKEGHDTFGSESRAHGPVSTGSARERTEPAPTPPSTSSSGAAQQDRSQTGSRFGWSDLEILGQAHLTYIVTQRRDALVVVDMHAAHERVKFETLMQAWRGGKIEVQDYLIPLTFDFTEEKVEALLAKSADLEKLGLYIEALGPETIGVKAAPPILSEKAIATELARLTHELTEYGEGFSLDRKIGDICATMACHSAIRAGQALSHDEMRSLLCEMDRFPLSSFCPHGRPVYVEYPFSKLERDFGRIV